MRGNCRELLGAGRRRLKHRGHSGSQREKTLVRKTYGETARRLAALGWTAEAAVPTVFLY